MKYKPGDYAWWCGVWYSWDINRDEPQKVKILEVDNGNRKFPYLIKSKLGWKWVTHQSLRDLKEGEGK